MNAKWDGITRLQGGQEPPEGILREEDIRLHTRLDMINRMALDLSTIPMESDVYGPIVDRIRKITGSKVVTISSFHASTRDIELRAISGKGRILDISSSIIKGKVIGKRMPVDDDLYEMMIGDEGGYSTDLHEASLHTIPKTVSFTLQHALGLKVFIGIALKYGDELLGTLMIMQGKGDPPVNLKLVNVMANVCSIIIRRRKIEANLLKAEARYKDLFESSQDAIFISTPDGRALDFNDALVDLLGYERKEIKEMNISGLYSHPGGRNIIIEKLEEKGFIKDHPVVFVRKDGELIECLITATIKEEDDGRKIYQGIIRDITKQRKAQMALLAERNRAELYFDLLGHDIGNIHQGLLGMVYVARDGGTDKKVLDETLGSAEDLLKRSVKLVANVRLMANLRNTDAQPDWIDLNPLLRDELEEMKRLFTGRNIEAQFYTEMKKAEVYAEPMVKEIFFNLLHNAVKVQDHDMTYLGIRVTEDISDKGYINIIIEDKGPGMPDDMKKNIMNIDDRATRKYRTGLGLSIVRSLVERYMGRIEIRNRVEGEPSKGTAFMVSLPGR